MSHPFRSLCLASAASLALAACTNQVVTDARPASAPLAAGAPQLGSFGFDEAGMDRSVAPGDDFYRYANGAWADTTPIPADRSNFGMFTVLDELSKTRTQAILDEAQDDPGSKIGNAYAAYLDEADVEARGMSPIQPWLGRIDAVSTPADYVAMLAEAGRNGIDIPIGAYIGQDDKDAENYVLFLVQDGLGMPDRGYYLDASDAMAQTRTAYLGYLTRMLAAAGTPDAAPRATALMEFETKIAKVHWTRVDSRDADKTYNKVSLTQLDQRTPGFDFGALLRASGINVDTLVVAQPSALEGEAALITQTPLSVLKDQLTVRSLHSYAEYLPEAIAAEDFAFYGTTLSGTPQRAVRWKRAVDFVSESLGEALGQVYVERYFPPATKAAADELVGNVLAAMGRRIKGLDWMSDQAKVRAQAKLAAFTPKIGYPDQWRDYSALIVARGDLFGNAMRAHQFSHDFEVGKLGQPIYRWEWHMTPMEINAYANFGMVEIVFPAAILQPPFFDPHADPAINYGGIGAVIGHEVSHHFDDQGAKYDETGQLSQWWTAEDVTRFKALAVRLVAQYDAYQPLPGMNVNGALTLGENIADLAGLTIAYDAYQASLGGKEAPVINGTTGDQRFYLGWAQVWRRNYREANLRQRLVTDPHSPSPQRASIVRNLAPWYAAFGVAQNAKLSLAPENRARIW